MMSQFAKQLRNLLLFMYAYFKPSTPYWERSTHIDRGTRRAKLDSTMVPHMCSLSCAGLVLVLCAQMSQAQFSLPIMESLCEDNGCFEDKNIKLLAVYSKPTESSTYVDVAIRGEIYGGGWIGFGLSKSGSMESSSVMACITDGTTHSVENYYNIDTGKSTIPASDTAVGLSMQEFELDRSIFHCTFRRDIDITMANSAQVFPLNKSYTLLLGRGPIYGRAVNYHSSSRGKSNNPVNLATNSENIGSAPVSPLLKAHGCLMITAWVMCAGVGIFMARYFKSSWPDQTLCKEKVWFAIHRRLMVLAVVLTICGFIVILVEKKGEYSVLQRGPDKAHPPLGIIVIILAIINPKMALFRPHRGTKRRPIFNWAHWGVGTSAHILSVITIFFGIYSTPAETFSSSKLRWVMVAYWVFHGVIFTVLEIVKSFAESEKTITDMQIELQQGGAIPENTHLKSNKYEISVRILIYWYVFCVFCLWMAMILIIGMEI